MAGVNNPNEAKTKFVPVKLSDNMVVRIEATVLSGESEESEGYIGVQLPSFDDITNTIKSVAKTVANVWDEVQPSKASVEFGIEVGLESGNLTALIVKGTGKANLKITLDWEQPPMTVTESLK